MNIKIKRTKSEVVLIINLAATILSFFAYFYDTVWSYVVPFAAAVISIWISLFVPFNNESFEKRWPTKKEKLRLYIIYLIANIALFAYKMVTVSSEDRISVYLSLIAIVLTSGLWALLYFGGLYTDEDELDLVVDADSDTPFYYESDEQTLKVFGVGDFWFSNRKHKRLCATYIKTAKEFSGKRSVEEIELRVRNRMMMLNSRSSSISTIIAMSLFGLFFLLFPWEPAWLLYLASPFQLYGILTVSRNLHDPLTPSESKDLKIRDSIEKGGAKIEEKIVPDLENKSTVKSTNVPIEKTKITKDKIRKKFIKYEKEELSSLGIIYLIVLGWSILWLGVGIGSSIPALTGNIENIYINGQQATAEEALVSGGVLLLVGLLVGGIPLFFLVKSFLKHVKRINNIKCELLRFEEEVVINKKIKTRTVIDSDGPIYEEKDYLITLSPSDGKIVVSLKKYNDIEIGDIIHTVYRGDSQGIADYYQDKRYEIIE